MNVPRERWAADKVYKKEASRKQRGWEGRDNSEIEFKNGFT